MASTLNVLYLYFWQLYMYYNLLCSTWAPCMATPLLSCGPAWNTSRGSLPTPPFVSWSCLPTIARESTGRRYTPKFKVPNALLLMFTPLYGSYIICKCAMLSAWNLYYVHTPVGKRNMTANVHSLLHLPDVVQRVDPLWAHSCFPYEDANGELLTLFDGSHAFVKQVGLLSYCYITCQCQML